MGHARCPPHGPCRCVWVMVDVGTGDVCTNPLDYWSGSGGIELSAAVGWYEYLVLPNNSLRPS